MAKKSRHQVALEERIEQLRKQEDEWTDKAAAWRDKAVECDRIAGEFEATRGELEAVLNSVGDVAQEEQEEEES